MALVDGPLRRVGAGQCVWYIYSIAMHPLFDCASTRGLGTVSCPAAATSSLSCVCKLIYVS